MPSQRGRVYLFSDLILDVFFLHFSCWLHSHRNRLLSRQRWPHGDLIHFQSLHTHYRSQQVLISSIWVELRQGFMELLELNVLSLETINSTTNNKPITCSDLFLGNSSNLINYPPVGRYHRYKEIITNTNEFLFLWENVWWKLCWL